MLIGANKLGYLAIGILPVVLLAIVFPDTYPGIQLSLLIVGDILAVIYFRRHVNWKIILRILPYCLIGIALGAVLIYFVAPGPLRRVCGGLLLGLVAMNLFRERLQSFIADKGLCVTIFFGVLLGFSTQLANAAGPIAAVYLLMLRLKKEEYIGIAAGLFLLLNCVKLPLFIAEDRIHITEFKMAVGILPLLFIGGILGVLFLNRVPQKQFERFIQILVFLSALYLLFAS